MIGLEYVCKIADKKYKELAKELFISTQVINNWIKVRKTVPEKYMIRLEYIFKVPSLYFNKELSELDKLEIQEINLINSYEKNGYNNEQVKLKIKENKKEAIETGKTNALLEHLGNHAIEDNDLVKKLKTVVELTKVPSYIIEDIILAMEAYNNPNIKKINVFSGYICEVIDYETQYFNYKEKRISKFDEDIRDFHLNKINKRRYVNCTEMMLEQVVPQDKKNKVHLYKAIDNAIENLEDKMSHNIVLDLYGLLTILINNNENIQISTVYMVLKALVEVCNKYGHYNPFPYEKNKGKNFMNKISRIVMQYEKEGNKFKGK